MLSITAGSDTYGRVKKVDATPVVTKFAMLSFLPIWPLESFYYAGPGESKYEGIPGILGSRTTAVRGFPLARVDKFSVMAAYYRGLCAALAILGFFAIVPGIMSLTGERLDRIAVLAMRGLSACFIGGLVAGLLSYCLPFQVSSRQRRIRRECGEILGLAADPALVRHDIAQAIDTAADDYRESGPAIESRWQLAHVRAQIALGHEREPLERPTDELLESVRQEE